MNMKIDMLKDKDNDLGKDMNKDRCQISDIGNKFSSISDVMSDSSLFGRTPEVLISGSRRLISDCYPW
jgi:hypothetical protein